MSQQNQPPYGHQWQPGDGSDAAGQSRGVPGVPSGQDPQHGYGPGAFPAHGQGAYGQGAPAPQQQGGQYGYGQSPDGQSGYDQYGYGVQGQPNAEPQGIAGPTGDGVQYGQPHGFGAPGPYGSGPQQSYGQEAHPYAMRPPTPAPRPAWKTVLGVVFAAIAALMTLGALSSLSRGGGPSSTSTAYLIGYVLGGVLMIVVPALVAWLLLRRR